MLDRRSASFTIACLPLLGAAGAPPMAFAQAAAQRDWRYCRKCQSMFFDGFPDKGRCAAGGGHEAAGFDFALPHDTAETAKAQGQWRYCGKCHGLYFNGFAAKGACPSGGGHQADGFNFVLPHDIATGRRSQTAWRYCPKCSSMFFDGFPGKGVCPRGGGHTAAGFVFVLPYETDPFTNALDVFWREAGRGIVSEQIRQSINGRQFRRGVSARDCDVHLADVSPSWRRTNPASLSLEMQVPRNNVQFKTTTPTILGSYADPSFRVGFDLLMQLAVRATAGAPNLIVDMATVNVSGASVHGSNASGTIVETLGDFFTHGQFSRSITERVNNGADVRPQLQNAINGAISRLANGRIP